MKSTAETPALGEIVRSFASIEVDDYQRTYEWEKESIQELFDDLKATRQTGQPHFFGTLIFETKKDEIGSLVDGQQRLTTVFCLVAAIRDKLVELEITELPAKTSGRRPTKVLDKALDFLHPGDNLDEFRFRSSSLLRETLASMVFVDPKSPKRSKIKLREAPATLKLRKGVAYIRELLEGHLKDVPVDSRGEELNELLDALLDQFRVLYIASSNLNESLDIFLTLNNRGTPLGRSDIVRGMVMKNMGLGEPESKLAEIHQTVLGEWMEIIEQVRDPETFMRHFLVSTTRSKVTKKKIVDEVSRRIRATNHDEAREKAQEFWDSLNEAATTYSEIVEGTVHKDIDTDLRLLNGLLKSHRIILLAVFRHEMSASEKRYLFELVEALSYRWIASGGNAQILENTFQEWAMDLHEGYSVASVVEKMEAKLGAQDFDVQSFLNNEGDTSYVVRALLYKLEMRLAKGANPVPTSKIHLEHIAPATSTPDWIEKLVPDRRKEAEYQIVNSSAGNLTLLDYKLNTSIKQAPFAAKSEEYQKATLLITRDIGKNFDDWSEQLINKRAEWLAECMNSIWNIKSKKTPLREFSAWLGSK